MSDKKYKYKGQEYSYSDLQSKYGDKVETAISKFGFEEVKSQPKYSYNGKEYSYDDLKSKYGDKTNEAIIKFGFEEVGGSKKKEESNSISPQKDLESNSENVSSGSQKNKTTADLKYKNSVEGTTTWNQDKIKQSNPEITKLFDEYQTAKSVSDDKKKEIEQSVDDSINQSGFWNNLKAFGKKGYNALVDFAFQSPEFTSVKATIKVNENPLIDELKEVEKQYKQEVKSAKENNEPIPSITKEERISRARQLKIEKDIKSQSETQVREFLKTSEKKIDDFGMSDKDKLNLFQQSELSSLSEKDKVNLSKQNIQRAEVDNLQKEISGLIEKAKKGEVSEDEFNEKGQLLDERYKAVIKESLDTYQEFVSNQKEIGDTKDNIDVFKRNYGWLKNFKDNAGATGLDLTAGMFGAGQWMEEALGIDTPASQIKARAMSGALTNTSKDVREGIAKPISVENINSASDFGEWFSNTALASQVPIYAAVATGVGGIGALGMSATGTQWEEMQQEVDKGDANYNYWQKTLVPLGYGVSETISASVDRLVLMNSKRIIQSALAPERKMIAEGMWKGFLNTGKEVIKNSAFEGADESATEIMQNLMDIYALGKKDVGVFDNVLDAGAAGAIMGALIPGVSGIVAQSIKPFSIDTKISEVNKNILKLEKALDSNSLSTTERAVMEAQLNKAKIKNQQLLEQEVKNISELSSDEFNAIKRIERTQSNVREQAKEIQRGDLAQDVKDLLISNLKEEFNASENERIGILRQDTNTLLNLLEPKEVIRLKDEASRELMQEKNTEGDKEITIEDDEISERALQNYKNSEKDTNVPLKNENVKEEYPEEIKNILEDDNKLKESSNDLTKRSDELKSKEIELNNNKKELELKKEKETDKNKIAEINKEIIETNKDLMSVIEDMMSINKQLSENIENRMDNNRKIVEYEKSQKGDNVSNESVRLADAELDTAKGELQNETQGNNEVQEIQSTDNTKGPKVIKASENSKEYTVLKDEKGKVSFVDKRGNTPSEKTNRKLSLEYAKQTDLTEGKRADETISVKEGQEVSFMSNKESNNFIAEKSENPLEIAEAIVHSEVESYRNDLDYKQSVIADNIGHLSRESFIEHSDANHLKENGSIPIQYLRKEGVPLDVKAKELSEISGVEITEQDIVDFILENPTGPQTFLNNGFKADMNSLKSRFEEVTGLPATNEILQEVIDQNKTKQDLQEQMTSFDFMSEEQLLNLSKEIDTYEKETHNSAERLSSNEDSRKNENKSRDSEVGSKENSPTEERTGQDTGGERINLSKDLFSKLTNVFQKFFGNSLVHSDINKLSKVLGKDPSNVFLQVDYKKLALENKYTQPKVPTKNIFFNDVEVLNRETESKVSKLVDEGTNVSIKSIDVTDIIPTQKNVNINNLKEVKDVRERPLLFKQGDKYYVIDGHHRISNEILEGEKKVEADVYDVDLQFMQTPDGTIWGATYLNEQGQREIYINESALSPETLLHEVYHPFDDLMFNASKEGDKHAISSIKRLNELAEQNGYLESVQNNPSYANKTLEEQKSEARVQMIGEVGNKQLDKSFYKQLESAVVDALKWLSDKLGISIKDYSPEQILNLNLEDIVKASLSSANKGDFESKINLSKDLKINDFISNIDKMIDNLDKFGKENLSMGLPLVVARQGLQAMKLAAKTAKSVADIISAGLNAVQQTDWYKNLSKAEQTDIDNNFIDYLNKPYETNKNTRGREKIEKEIQDALNNGKTEKEIIDSYTDRMEKMMAKDYFERNKAVDPKDAKKQVDDAFEKSEKRMEELTNPKFDINKLFRGFVTKFFDRQFLPKFLLNKAGGRIVRDYIVTAKGAAGYAKFLYEQAYGNIYKGLSSDQIKVLDKVIQLRRFIAIDENRRKHGLPTVVHPDYINENVSKSYLDSLKQELGDKAYNDLNKRADAYFDTFKSLLDEMHESGIISKESRDRFFEVDYQPREFLEFLNEKDLETNSLDNVNVGGLGQDQIQKLEKGLDTALITDSQYLLSKALGVRAKSIAMNRVNERLVYFMNEQSKKIDELKKKNKPTKKDKKLINDFKTLSKHVKSNPIVGFTESGNPIYKHKKTPNGFSNAYYWVDGVKQNILMETGFHEQYFDSLKFLFKDSKSKEKITLASGTALVKSIATGNNPAFFIVNTPRDFYNILAFSEEYNANVLLSSLRLINDARKGIKDISGNSSTYENFVKYGGMTDFLMNQGKFKNTKMVSEQFEKIGIGNKGRERWNKVISIVTLQKMQVYSEIGFRVAVFRRSISNQLKEMGLNDISQVKDKRTLEDIYTNAVASARNTTDFNQGGTVIKDADSIIPYLNAATQSSRVMVDAFNERPLETTARVLQLAAYSSPVPIGISLMLFSKFKGDDDKDKSNSELYFEAWKGVSKYDRINYFIIFTGKRKPNGEFEYYRIAKAQQLTPLFTLTEGIIHNQMKEGANVKEEGTMIEDMKWGFANNISPVDFGFGGFETFAKNPALKSFISYSAGYDFFREQDISPDKGKVPVAAEGFGSKNVEDFYKITGESLGLSPARLKASVESFITTPSTSPYIGLTYDTADFIASDKDLKDSFSDFGGKTLKSFTGRVVKETSEYNRRIGNKEKIKDAVEKIEISRLKTKLNFNTLVADLKEGKITQKEIETEIKNLADKEPFEAKRTLNRVKDQLKNKNTPAFVFEVKYANTNKERAVLLADKFGDALLNPSKLQEKEKLIIGLLKRNSALNKETFVEYEKLVK